MAEKVYETCCQMLDQRNYYIIDQDGDKERILAARENPLTKLEEQICVFITKSSKFNVDSIQEYISMMKEMDIWNCIIVYQLTATPVAKKIVQELKEMNIELFTYEELQFNLTNHYLYSKHELVLKGTPEFSLLKEKYIEDLPTILKSDPVCRFFGFNRNDFIKVTRQNGTVIYRIVK